MNPEEQQEEQDLLSNNEEEDCHQQSTDFGFSDFLVKIAGETRNTVFQRELFLYKVQLAASLIMFSIAVGTGASSLDRCSHERMICVFLLVQGTCGLFVVLIHVAGSIASFYTSHITPIRWLFAFAHCLVIFCILWFILGHVWVFQRPHRFNRENSCSTAASHMGVLVILFDYLLGISYLCSRLWSHPIVLHRLQTLIQRQIDSLPPRRVLAMADEPSDQEDGIFLNLNKSHIVFLLIGAILAGTPLLVVFALYTNSQTTDPTSLPVSLPTQCYTYTLNTDATRLDTSSSCCQNDQSIPVGWYRFSGPAGHHLLMKPPSRSGACAASYPGWWNGTLPMKVGGITTGYVCFVSGSSCIDPMLAVAATNCSGFYVFYLSASQGYQQRYCTSF